MGNSIFYKNVKCVFTNEGKSIFAQQPEGVKFSKVGAILFSDTYKAIQNEYVTDNNLKILENFELRHMKKYTTLIYQKVDYSYNGSIFTPKNIDKYDSAYADVDKVLPIQIAYGNDEILNEDQEITYDKYISYDLILRTNSLSVDTMANMKFDGFILVGLPHKTTTEDSNEALYKDQNFASLAIFYFPGENEKLEIVYGQLKEVAMNVELHIHMNDAIRLEDLKYVNYEEIELKKPLRFINGLHMVNDGLHDRG